MGSYPMEESYSKVIDDIDYFIFSGTPKKHFMSPYDVKVLDDFLFHNTTLETIISKDTEQYKAVIYKTIN